MLKMIPAIGLALGLTLSNPVNGTLRNPVSATLSNPVSAPFAFSGGTWCPSYQEQYGCNTLQHPKQYVVSFSPAQVSRDSSGYIDMTMNSAGTLSGALNSEGNETWTPLGGHSFAETINIPCNGSGKVENWPAFWMLGTQGHWPANGEIDIAEGSASGDLGWHFHYLNASGQSVQKSGHPAGNWCGLHKFDIYFYVDPNNPKGLNTTNRITYWWGPANGSLTKVGQVTSQDLGVPIPSDPYYVINDFGARTGAVTPNATFQVRSFSHS